MTTERIVGPLQKVMQSIADLAVPRDPSSERTALPHTHASETGHEARPTAKLAPSDPSSMLAASEVGFVLPPSGEDGLRSAAFGLPPPAVALNTGHAATLPLATALQAVGDRFLAAPTDTPRRKDEAGDDRPSVISVINVQASGEVRETQFVKGAPKASTTIAVDDRPRLSVPATLRDDVARPERQSESRRSDPEPTQPDPSLSSPTMGLEQRAHVRPDPPLVEALATALRAPSATDALAGRILPSAILNAAMLPGWPPPRLLEGKAILPTDSRDLAALRREDQIAVILAALGSDLTDMLGGTSDRKTHWRWLRRISQILAGLMVLVATISAELAELQGEEEDFLEGRGTAGPRQGTKRRIYLD